VLIYFVERVDEKQRRIAKFLTGAIEAGTTVVVERSWESPSASTARIN
jgi:hypothetical protein